MIHVMNVIMQSTKCSQNRSQHLLPASGLLGGLVGSLNIADIKRISNSNYGESPLKTTVRMHSYYKHSNTEIQAKVLTE